MATIKPIFRLADSQLLFWRQEGGTPFLDRVRAQLDDEGPLEDPKAAYLGASNGDAAEFYDLFTSAMHAAGIRTCRLIPTMPDSADFDFLAEADLILLAGGDTLRGWTAFEEAGIKDRLIERYYGGALLMGVSAGAVQLGLKGWDEAGGKLFDTLRLVPFVVDVHDEPSWSRLHQAVPRAGEHGRGFGIPTGGGAVYHPDYSVEPVRHPLVEVSLRTGDEDDGDGEGALREATGPTRQALLFPGESTRAGVPAQAGEPGELGEPALAAGEDVVN